MCVDPSGFNLKNIEGEYMSYYIAKGHASIIPLC